MAISDDVLQRLAALETKQRIDEKEIEELKEKINDLVNLRLRVGSFLFGVICFGAMIGGNFDKVKEQIIGWLK